MSGGKRGNIMIVGDSITTQFTAALMNAIIRDRPGSSCDLPFRTFFGSYNISCSNDTQYFQIINHRNDRLSPTLMYLKQESANFHEWPW